MPPEGADFPRGGPSENGQPPTASPKSHFSWPLRVYWEDTDAGGIVFYANYLKFFERARTEWLRSLGIAQQQLRETTGGIFVVTDTTLRYHRPARLDDELIVTAGLIEKGRASLIIGQQALLKSEQTPTLLCEGTVRIGWVDAASLKPARIPAHLLDRLETTT
ncbi:tol-pal system-associated acyl-CoA thioesterase [Polaromonas sp. UC242_47]|uniref:tol-pal system-associated acyl-CoA thioesterase n=1 Tax=Polaromonas sp. UC242_47 TaxID=3374626 RepID=UPI003796C83A